MFILRQVIYWFREKIQFLLELEAIQFSLLSLIKQFENNCIFWYTDNFAIQQIKRCVSNKSHIRSLALNIFNLKFDHNIHLKTFWVG